jgi:predicted nucleic acid-binding protein
MTFCVDTNVLLPMLSLTHPARAIRLAWMQGRFIWALSTEILLEYEEIALPRIGQRRWQEFRDLLELASVLHGNVRKTSPTYRFHIITACPDDDKFADCAITAEADYIITSDKHFNALIGSGYQPQPITPEEFIARFPPGE